MAIYYPGHGSYDVTVKGTGVALSDRALLNIAVAQLNLAQRGTLIIEGNVIVDTTHNFTSAISMRGRDANSSLTITSTADDFAAFTWNDAWTVAGASNHVMSATGADFAEYVTCAAHNPDKGEWVCLHAANEIPGAYWHDGTYQPRPMEIHQVSYVDLTNDRVYVGNGFVVDQMTTTPRLVVVPMVRNVTVRDLHVEHAGGCGSYTSLFRFKCIDGLVVENIHSNSMSPGCIWARLCANVRMHGIQILGTEANDLVYGVICGVCNGFQLCDSQFSGTRHAFSTASEVMNVSPPYRYGTPLNVIVDNVTATGTLKRDLDPGIVQIRGGNKTDESDPTGAVVTGSGGATGVITSFTPDAGLWVGAPGNKTGSIRIGTIVGQFLTSETFTLSGSETGTFTTALLARNIITTHPEGYGIRFSNCTVDIAGSWPGMSGGYCRARNTEWVGCTFRSNGSGTSSYATGLMVQAPNCRVSNCLFHNCCFGIQVLPGVCDATERSNGLSVVNCEFVNMRGPGVFAPVGNGHSIMNNKFVNCGAATQTGGAPKTDLAMVAGGVTMTSASGFTSAYLKRTIVISAGTHFVPGTYWVASYVNPTTITLDRDATDGTNATGGTGTFEVTTRSCIQLYGIITDSHRVIGNDLGKGANTYSIDTGVDTVPVYAMGNIMTGYGAGVCGFGGYDGVANEASLVDRNFTS